MSLRSVFKPSYAKIIVKLKLFYQRRLFKVGPKSPLEPGLPGYRDRKYLNRCVLSHFKLFSQIDTHFVTCTWIPFMAQKNERNWSFKPTTTVPLLGRQPLKALISPWGLIKFRALLKRGGGGGLFDRGAYLKFFDRQRQNYIISMEFEMLRSFNNNLTIALCNKCY